MFIQLYTRRLVRRNNVGEVHVLNKPPTRLGDAAQVRVPRFRELTVNGSGDRAEVPWVLRHRAAA